MRKVGISVGFSSSPEARIWRGIDGSFVDVFSTDVGELVKSTAVPFMMLS